MISKLFTSQQMAPASAWPAAAAPTSSASGPPPAYLNEADKRKWLTLGKKGQGRLEAKARRTYANAAGAGHQPPQQQQPKPAALDLTCV